MIAITQCERTTTTTKKKPEAETVTENNNKEILSTDFNVVANEAFIFITCQKRTHLFWKEKYQTL